MPGHFHVHMLPQNIISRLYDQPPALSYL